MLDFIKANFATLLLSFFILLFTAVTLFVFWKFGMNKDAVDWAKTAFVGFMSAMLGLITGKALGKGDGQ